MPVHIQCHKYALFLPSYSWELIAKVFKIEAERFGILGQLVAGKAHLKCLSAFFVNLHVTMALVIIILIPLQFFSIHFLLKKKRN